MTKPLHPSETDDADQLNLPVNEPEGPTLADRWRTIVRYKWGILSLALTGTVIGVLSAYTAVPVYQASTTMVVEPADTKLVGVQPLDGAPPINLFYETQYEIIRSRRIAETVVDKLQLADDPRFLSEKQPFVAAQSTAWIRNWLPEPWREYLSEAPEPPNEQAQREAAVAKVREGLTVKGGQRSQVVEIHFDDAIAQLAARITNGIAKAYAEYGLNSRMASSKQATRWLSDRLGELRKKLDESETTLQAFQSRESMVDTSSHSKMIGARLSQLASKLVEAQASLSVAEIRYGQVKKASRSGDIEALIPVLNSSLTEQITGEHARLKAKVAELAERYGNKHPKLIAAKSDLQEATNRLKEEIDTAVAGLRKNYEAAAAQEREARRLIEEQQQAMRTLTGKGFELAKLERDVEANRQLYNAFLTRFKEIDVAKESDIPNVRVIDEARVPSAPYKPNKQRVIIASLILGLLAGIALAFLRERLDNTFKKTSDIEERLLLPVLAEVHRLDQGKDKALLPERQAAIAPRSTFSESINNIRTGVMFSNLDNPVKTLLVTSSIASEGKTTLASNMAIAFSRVGKTLLMDADLRHPDIRRVCGVKQQEGFSEWVSGSKTLEECYAQDKDFQNLYIMPAGTIPPNPLELLSSKTFRNALEEVKNRFDYIIIDTPPVVPVSDAIVLGNLVDGVIVSVKFDGTTFPIAQEMLKRLRSNNIEPLGAVLSLFDPRKAKSYYGRRYYGSYYGSHYGKYGYGEEPTKA